MLHDLIWIHPLIVCFAYLHYISNYNDIYFIDYFHFLTLKALLSNTLTFSWASAVITKTTFWPSVNVNAHVYARHFVPFLTWVILEALMSILVCDHVQTDAMYLQLFINQSIDYGDHISAGDHSDTIIRNKTVDFFTLSMPPHIEAMCIQNCQCTYTVYTHRFIHSVDSRFFYLLYLTNYSSNTMQIFSHKSPQLENVAVRQWHWELWSVLCKCFISSEPRIDLFFCLLIKQLYMRRHVLWHFYHGCDVVIGWAGETLNNGNSKPPFV
jgi:hypothetical protein